jgi:glycosyltransferase involved in cell wall biosynthesis
MKPLCVVSCPIDTFSGYGARSRDFVRALIKVKEEEWNIKIMPQRWGDCPWNYLSKDDPLRKRFVHKLENKPDIWFQITVPNEFTHVGHYSVGVTAGIETDIFPGEFIEGINRMDLTLVSSQHSKNVALNTTFTKVDAKTKKPLGETKCVKPVEVCFEGLDLEKYFKKPEKSNLLNDIKEDFCFLYTGHWLPGNFGEDRKNTALLIRTFLETFNTPSNKKPALILKTNKVDYSILDQEVVLKDINILRKKYGGKNSPNIYLLHGEVTDNEMNLLNNDPKVKAFVSFTKGEGFGRPLLEAAITGKPIIVSNWSGHIDFLHPDYNILIGGELKKVHKSAANQFLLEDSKWFNIAPDIAGRAMKDVFKKYKNYLERTRKQTQNIKNNWSFDKMAELIDKLMPKDLKAQPKNVGIQLPKLKKVNNTKDTPTKMPKLKLPKLNKIEA